MAKSYPQQDLTTSRRTWKLIGSYKNIVFDDNFINNMDKSKTEEMGWPMNEHTIQDKVNVVIEVFSECKICHRMAQMLHIFLKNKALRNEIQLLCKTYPKEAYINDLVSKQYDISPLAHSKNWCGDRKSAHRALLTCVVEKGTSSNRLMSMITRCTKYYENSMEG